MKLFPNFTSIPFDYTYLFFYLQPASLITKTKEATGQTEQLVFKFSAKDDKMKVNHLCEVSYTQTKKSDDSFNVNEIKKITAQQKRNESKPKQSLK